MVFEAVLPVFLFCGPATYFLCTEKDGTVGAGSQKVQGSETLKSLTFRASGLTIVLRIGAVCPPVDKTTERSVNE